MFPLKVATGAVDELYDIPIYNQASLLYPKYDLITTHAVYSPKFNIWATASTRMVHVNILSNMV